MFGSDSELKDHVRGQVGATRDRDLPEHVLDDELERGKNEITREVKERLNTGDSLNFYRDEAEQEALKYFLLVRARGHVLSEQARNHRGSKPDFIRKGGPPKTISTMRRSDFGDQTMNHWRDRLVTHLNRVTE